MDVAADDSVGAGRGGSGQPLRILVYGLNFAPELTGIGRYTGEMAAWLAEQGHDVTVVTGYPYYPHWQLAKGYPSWRWSHEAWRGMHVLRCPVYVPRQPNAVTRILHLLSFSLLSGPVAVAAALWRRPDIVLTIEPATSCTPWALFAAKAARASSWLHVQDVELGAALRLGLVRAGWLSRLVSMAYGALLRRFDRVTTLSQRMRAELAQFGRALESIEIFPNWVNLARFEGVDPMPMRRELELGPDHIAVLYAGNLGEKQGVESLLEVARMLRDEPSVRFIICGAGATRDRIAAQLSNHPNITLLEPQPDERFVELLHAADIHVMPQRKGMTNFVTPSKLPAMMASGRVIVAQTEPGCPVHDILHTAGVLVDPENALRTAEAIRALSADPNQRSRLAEHSRARARTFNREEVLSNAFAYCGQAFPLYAVPGQKLTLTRRSQIEVEPI
jgi:colanic acid biosynthesis glycosyl transferase WcaI